MAEYGHISCLLCASNQHEDIIINMFSIVTCHRYTYGKPVKGHVTLRVSKGRTNWWFFEPRAIQTEFEV